MLRGEQVKVPSAGQNRRICTFGALDWATEELSVMVTEKKRSVEFLEFIKWLVDSVYVDYEHVYFFLDNCAIHKTKAVREFLTDNIDRVSVTFNAVYAPNLNDIERVWGQLKRTAIDNYYFTDIENLEETIIKAVGSRNKKKRKQYMLMLHNLLQAA